MDFGEFTKQQVNQYIFWGQSISNGVINFIMLILTIGGGAGGFVNYNQSNYLTNC
mgnify:CR=1 FL=1